MYPSHGCASGRLRASSGCTVWLGQRGCPIDGKGVKKIGSVFTAFYTFTDTSGHPVPAVASRGRATRRGRALARDAAPRRIAFASPPGRHGQTGGAASARRVEAQQKGWSVAPPCGGAVVPHHPRGRRGRRPLGHPSTHGSAGPHARPHSASAGAWRWDARASALPPPPPSTLQGRPVGPVGAVPVVCPQETVAWRLVPPLRARANRSKRQSQAG